ncbi:MAG: hypothetical protein F4Z87_00045, partial [Gammaproteobacteria bacterium]|nr:hypothetical protein [Gammaproteobacteria bacterium]
MNSLQRIVISATVGLALGVTVGSLLYCVFSWDRHRAPQTESTTQHSSQLVDVESNRGTDQESLTQASDSLWSDRIGANNLIDLSSLVASVDMNELQTMVDQVLIRPWIPRLFNAKKLLLGKLAQFEPRVALDRVLNASRFYTLDLVDVVFREWSVQNLEDSLANASELAQPYRDVAFTAIVSEQDAASFKNAGKFPNSEELKAFLDKWEAASVILELKQNPVEAARQLLNDDIPNREQIALLEQIVDAWQPHMGFDILYVLLDQLYFTDSKLSWELVVRVLSSDPAAAMEHITSGEQIKRPAMVGRHLVNEHWTEIGALKTMVAAQELEGMGLGNIYLLEFLSVWGEEDSLGLLNQIDQVPTYARPFAVGKAIRKLAERDIGAARRSFESLEAVPGAISEFAESELVRGWA